MAKTRRYVVVCAECGKELRRANATECLSCLRLFHSGCLVRVKVKDKRPSYLMCRKCLEEKPSPNRTIMEESDFMEHRKATKRPQRGTNRG